jgi:flavin-dependent dehydrogenase
MTRFSGGTYDVLIAGGGYAAQVAARDLRAGGYSTLLVDRRSRAGYPPQSTSGLARRWVERFRLPVSGEATPITSFRVYGPFGTEALLGRGLLGEVGETLVEPNLLGRMERESVARGLEVAHGATVMRVRGGPPHATECYVTPPGEWVRAVNVFDATGFQAWVGRQAGMLSEMDPEDVHGGVEVSVPRPESHPAGEVRMWLGHRVAPWGYAWGFPSRENGTSHVRLGLGTPRCLPESAGVHFARFRSAHPEYDGPVHHRVGGIIPTSPVARVLMRRRIFLLGDAARLCCPLTGGGILGALASGEAAARAVVENDPWAYARHLSWLRRELRARWIVKQLVYGLTDPELARLVLFLGDLRLPDAAEIDPLVERRRVTRRLLLREPRLALSLLSRGRFWRAMRPN